MTSTTTAIKRMGRNWKKLQRWVYLAAFMVCTLGFIRPAKRRSKYLRCFDSFLASIVTAKLQGMGAKTSFYEIAEKSYI